MTLSKNSLKNKVTLYLVISLAAATFTFAMLVVKNNRQELRAQVITQSAQLADVVIRSTRFAMLENKPSQIDQIIEDVANQNQIEKVRVLSKEGVIIHSSQQEEIGLEIDQENESCMHCHRDAETLAASPQMERARFFNNENGERLLGSTKVIHNEPTCAGSGCHETVEETSVLGVLDIIYPLEEIESRMRRNTMTIFGFSIGFILMAGLLVSYLINRFIYVPLRDMDTGAARLANGDLTYTIPVRSNDEFGQLAESFNSMTKALHNSRVDLEDWGKRLEEKVKEATRELQIAHAETARSEKLASVGLLAAGIAHELNNPLTGVLTFAYLVKKNLPPDSRDAQDLELVIRETKRCAGIIRRLLDFSREKPPEKAYGDLNAIVTDTLALIKQPTELEDIELITSLDEQMPPVWMDENLIKQVIMNMLVNARHAITNGGTIKIKTRVRKAGDCPAAIRAFGDMAEITISDTGCGIPEKDLKKIFDPFFTTKEVGKGTGLGLSVSYSTVEAHRGTIEVDSVEGEGTEFRIYLAINKKKNPGSDL
jgi:two-component system NtrC family sensor kinase